MIIDHDDDRDDDDDDHDDDARLVGGMLPGIRLVNKHPVGLGSVLCKVITAGGILPAIPCATRNFKYRFYHCSIHSAGRLDLTLKWPSPLVDKA